MKLGGGGDDGKCPVKQRRKEPVGQDAARLATIRERDGQESSVVSYLGKSQVHSMSIRCGVSNFAQTV